MTDRAQRSLPPLRLSKSPLVLVLCQVRLAAVRSMREFIPQIQDRLRRAGFPIDVSGEAQDIAVEGNQMGFRRTPHWEFRTKDERWSIIVREQAVVVQTSAYENFETFLERLHLATETVSEVVKSLVIERIGLRYVDMILPGDGESWRDYVREGLHGVQNSIVRDDSSEIFTQLTCRTGENSRLILRVAQNRQGMVLPPDLLAHAPALGETPPEGVLVTLLDLDHFLENRVDYSGDGVDSMAWQLHDPLDILFRDTVTPRALKAWQ